MRALVTGFDAFGGAAANASYAAVARLPARLGSLEIATTLLPTSYARSGARLVREIQRVKPALVLCVGEAGERHELNVERIAINIQNARIADNDGAQPLDLPIVNDASAAYFATLPVRAIHTALLDARLPATMSNSAGTFVCNHVFYTLMHLAATMRPNFIGGFLHVPAWREQAPPATSNESTTLDDIVRGISIALEVSAAHVPSKVSARPA